MRFALISDIHANLEALETVLKDIALRRVDKIHCLGDVVGYGCDPIACLELIQKECDIKLIGNHEYAVLDLITCEHMNQYARKSITWTKDELSDRDISIISDFELEAQFADCHLVHASPFESDQWHYLLKTSEAITAFDHFSQQIGFVGHTHLPMIFSRSSDGTIRCKTGHDFDMDEESRYLINTGSVGQPRDTDARACYIVCDSSEQAVTYHRVAYDVKKTQAKMSRAEMPKMLVERLEVGR